MQRLLLLAALALPLAAQPRVLMVLGGPGSGKTTQSAALARRLNLPVINAVDMLLASLAKDSPMAAALKESYASGDFIDDESVDALIEKRIGQPDAQRGFLLDGYPGARAQANRLTRILNRRGLPDPVIIYLDLDDDIARERLLKRGDKPEVIDRRLAEFHRVERDLLAAYSDVKVIRVDASFPPEQVTNMITKALP